MCLPMSQDRYSLPSSSSFPPNPSLSQYSMPRPTHSPPHLFISSSHHRPSFSSPCWWVRRMRYLDVPRALGGAPDGEARAALIEEVVGDRDIAFLTKLHDNVPRALLPVVRARALLHS